MLDEELSQSFDLDYEIFNAMNNKFKKFSKAPQIKSNDLLREYENYIILAQEIFTCLIELLNSCNDERMKFRMLLIKMSKNRTLMDKLFEENDDMLILKKLKVHEELKNKIIDRHLDIIYQNEKIINQFQNKQNKQGNVSINNTSCNLDKSQSVKKRSLVSPVSQLSSAKASVRTKSKTIASTTHKKPKIKASIDVTPAVVGNKKRRSASTITNVISSSNIDEDYILKKMFNLDYNTEKYNISSSPIQTPKNNSKKIISNENSRNLKTEKSIKINKIISKSIDFDYECSKDIKDISYLKNHNKFLILNEDNFENICTEYDYVNTEMESAKTLSNSKTLVKSPNVLMKTPERSLLSSKKNYTNLKNRFSFKMGSSILDRLTMENKTSRLLKDKSNFNTINTTKNLNDSTLSIVKMKNK